MSQQSRGHSGHDPGDGDLVDIDLNFASMRRFQAEFSPNLSNDGLFIDTGEPLNPGSVVRFRVILPEEFIFLEGTAVVEWARPVEAMGAGAPGMALRFVTLSPQNHELVEQLVQNYIDQGGVPFDLDYRPDDAGLPIEDVEEPPPPEAAGGRAGEAVRLTIRGTEPNPAAAMGGPEGTAPDDATGAGEGAVREPGAGPGAGRELRGLEIVSVSASVREIEDADEAAAEQASAGVVDGGEPVGGEIDDSDEPPDLDWSDDGIDVGETAADEDASGGVPPVGAVEPVPPAADFELALDDQPDDEPVVARPPFLSAPGDFDDGPEIVDDASHGAWAAGPAFDVSLPEADDEPDTTPVMADDGDSGVVVEPTGEAARPRRRYGRLPAALLVIALIAVAGVFLWPRVRGWVSGSGGEQPTTAGGPVAAQAEPAATEDTGPPGDADAPAVDAGAGVQAEAVGSTAATDAEPAAGGGDAGGVTAEAEPAAAAEAEKPPVAQAVLPPADTVLDIGFSARESATVVIIRANGSLENGAIALAPMPAPPRILIRVSGIENTFRPYTIDASTPEITTIRTGLHEERRPPELWVVLDLADPEAAVGGVDIRGDTLELTITRP